MWIGWGNFSEWGGGVLVRLLLSAGISLSLSDNLIWKGTDDLSLKSNNLSLLLKCSWRYPKNLSAYLSWWSFCNNKVGAVSYYSLLLHFVNNLVASPLELLSPIILSCVPLTEWPSYSLAHPSYNELFTLHHAHPFRVRKTFVRIPLCHSLEILYFCKCVSWEMKKGGSGKKSLVQHLWK